MRAPLGWLVSLSTALAACGSTPSVAPAAGGGGSAGTGTGGNKEPGQGAGGSANGLGQGGSNGQGTGGGVAIEGGAGGAAGSAGSLAPGDASAAVDGTSSNVDARPPTDAAPAVNGGRFPFPQNQRLARCNYPSAASADDARRAYDRWKSELVTATGAGGHLRVRRPNSPGAEVDSTVSEGIAYGMVLALAMDDPGVLDELWKYAKAWFNGNGLMDWYINAAGTARLGTGGATDADEDMAFALIMASRKWGGSGTIGEPYLDAAKRLIDSIWQHEIDHGNAELLLPGDSWAGNVIFNPSYFAPNQYRIFGVIAANVDGWNRVIDTGYTVLARSINASNGNLATGLPPAWCGADGNVKEPFSGGATNYQYDAARVPFRIGQDFCNSGEPRAAAFLGPISTFFAGVGAANIVDGYDLGGAPHPDPATPAGSPQSAVFLGGASVGAMHDAKFRAFIDDTYARVATGDLLARSRYYNLSWTALSLLLQTGNLVEYPP